MELTDLHRRTVEHWQRLVDGVRPEQWDQPTPCSDWAVRQLVNHVVGEERWTRPLVEGSTIDEVGDRFDGDLLGDQPGSAARDAAEDAAAAVDDRLPGGGIVHLSFGETPMEEYVRQLSADHLVHAWDLAAATGQDRTLDPALVEDVAAWFAERESMYRDAGAIGPRPEVTGDDSQANLLAAFGRNPAW